MVHAFAVSVHAFVTSRFIRVDRRVRFRDLINETQKRFPVNGIDHPGRDLARFPVLRADRDRLALRSLPHTGLAQLLPLRVRHVRPPAAEHRLVNLNRSLKGFPKFTRPRFPYTVQHEPGALLRHVDVAMQLHAADALQVGHLKVDSENPLTERQV